VEKPIPSVTRHIVRLDVGAYMAADGRGLRCSVFCSAREAFLSMNLAWGNDLRKLRLLTKSLSVTTKESLLYVLCNYCVIIIERRYYYFPFQKDRDNGYMPSP
jgi:hypothetical protein